MKKQDKQEKEMMKPLKKKWEPKFKVSRSYKRITINKFTALTARKIDEIIESVELNSEEKVALIKYYMDKWRNY